MGKLIKKDSELADQLEMFFKRLRSACDQSTSAGRYFAHIAENLSEQRASFFASLAVSSYSRLETPCTNNLPYYIDVGKLTNQVFSYVNESRKTVASNNIASNFVPSKYAGWILNPDWPVSVYGTNYEEGVLWIGKRHPRRIAQESMRLAASYDSEKLLDKALFALESYVNIDTSIFEIYKRIAQCYEDLWGESSIDAPCELSVLVKLFDPYAAKANPELDYRYRENQITPELIVNIANLL